MAAKRKARFEGVPDPSRIQDLFLSRLDQLEQRVAGELERPAQAGSPLQEFLLDLSREAWGAARAAASMATEPARLLASAALALAAGPSDDTGLDRPRADLLRELLRPLVRLWLGLAHAEGKPLPAEGGVLVLVNRSAWPLPFEALALWTALGEYASGRPMHVLWDGRYLEFPAFGEPLASVGFAPAHPDSVRALLERGRVVIAFPEGRAALDKTYERRYRLARFDDAELIEAALDTDAAIVPAALLGNEESYPVLARVAGFPVTAQFPLAGVAGLLPLPLQWSLRLGPPLELGGSPDLSGVSDMVRARIQAMLGEMLGRRSSIFTG